MTVFTEPFIFEDEETIAIGVYTECKFLEDFEKEVTQCALNQEIEWVFREVIIDHFGDVTIGKPSLIKFNKHDIEEYGWFMWSDSDLEAFEDQETE